MHDVAVYNNQQHQQFSCSGNRITLYEATDGRWRATSDNTNYGSSSTLSARITANFLVIENAQHDLYSADDRKLQLGESLPMPALFRVGTTWIEIASQGDESTRVVPLKQSRHDDISAEPRATNTHSGPSSSTVTKWLTEAARLYRAAAGSAEFYADAARFAVDSVGLDAAWVLSRDNDSDKEQWQIAGSCIPHPEYGVRFDTSTLKTLSGESVAWYMPTDEENAPSISQAIVVAPVLDAEGRLVAAIYGARNTWNENRRRSIRPLESQLVQLLAEFVAVGISRIQRETEAARTRVLLEHAFSPSVAEHIQQHPESLAGQQREVTLMFADLRGYTSLVETMPADECYELLGDVMESLTQVVMSHGGVVVDYYGDGLLALWNAPLEQPNHADLACFAALEMFETLPSLTAAWLGRLDGPLELGVGIHTGAAHVGNAGTRSRLKYGPRGNAVNIASRVQSASKQLQLPLVITAATQVKLSDKFFSLRVCTAKLPGLEKPMELFTVYPASEALNVKSRLDQYSRALELFEAGDLEEAEGLLKQLVSLGQVTPAHFLAHYTAAQKNGNLGRRAVDKYAAGAGSVIEILAK